MSIIDPDWMRGVLRYGHARRQRALAAGDVDELVREGQRWLVVGARLWAAGSGAESGKARMKAGRRAWDKATGAILAMDIPPDAKADLLVSMAEAMEGAFWAGSAMGALQQDLQRQHGAKRTRGLSGKKRLEAVENKVKIGAALMNLCDEDPAHWGAANARKIAEHLEGDDALGMDLRTIMKHLKALGVPGGPPGRPGRPRVPQRKSRST